MNAPKDDGQQLVEQLGLFCQRWTRKRVSYRPAGEIFDPRYVSVEPIEEREAKAFIEANHYCPLGVDLVVCFYGLGGAGGNRTCG